MFVSPNTPSAISFKSKRKRTKGSKKRRIASLAKTLNIFIRENAIKLGNDAADDDKHICRGGSCVFTLTGIKNHDILKTV